MFNALVDPPEHQGSGPHRRASKTWWAGVWVWWGKHGTHTLWAGWLGLVGETRPRLPPVEWGAWRRWRGRGLHRLHHKSATYLATLLLEEAKKPEVWPAPADPHTSPQPGEDIGGNRWSGPVFPSRDQPLPPGKHSAQMCLSLRWWFLPSYHPERRNGKLWCTFREPDSFML